MTSIVVKLMSTTRPEFERSLALLQPMRPIADDGTTSLPFEGQEVAIRFEALPPRRLGGLVVMPQARVTIDLSAIADGKRASFLRRFDLAFQRGGG